MSPRTLALLIGSQLVIWIAIKAALYMFYRDNPSHGVGLYASFSSRSTCDISRDSVESVRGAEHVGSSLIAASSGIAGLAIRSCAGTCGSFRLFMLAMLIVGFVIELYAFTARSCPSSSRPSG